MSLLFLKKKARRLIFPTRETLATLRRLVPEKPLSILDVGCGSGWFLKLVMEAFPGAHCGVGLETDERYFGRYPLPAGMTFEIMHPDQLGKENIYDLLIMNDVLHHVHEKKNFLANYSDKVKPGGLLFIKDMNPENLTCKYWNRFHDLIASGDRIEEISADEISLYLNNDNQQWRYQLLEKGKKRIGPYDHYWVIFKKSL